MRMPLLISLAGALMAAQFAPPRKDIPTIAKAANGAVVSIIMSDKNGQPIAQGSGFLVSKDGRIVTNYHVIKSGSSAIVKLPDGAFFVVNGLLAFDKERDIAIIKAHGENFRTLTLGDSGRVQVGDEVVAIGNPLSLESTVSNGIVSAIRTTDEHGRKFLQITAPISPGSSGGPLFDMAGQVVGITTYGVKGGENLNFAIPVNDAKRLLAAKFPGVQVLPNEAEVASPPPPPPGSVPIPPGAQVGQPPPKGVFARDYYQQLYNAGGLDRMADGHACFEDDPKAEAFFIFGQSKYIREFMVAGGMFSKLPKSVQQRMKKDFLIVRGYDKGVPWGSEAFLDKDEGSWISEEHMLNKQTPIRIRFAMNWQTLRYKWAVEVLNPDSTYRSEVASFGKCEEIPPGIQQHGE